MWLGIRRDFPIPPGFALREISSLEELEQLLEEWQV